MDFSASLLSNNTYNGIQQCADFSLYFTSCVCCNPSYAVPCSGIAKIGTEKRRFIMEFDNILSQLREEDRMGIR